MQREHGFNFYRRDVLATADDHVVDPTCDKQVAVGIDIAGVAGEVPALAQALGVGLGPVVVTLEGLVGQHVSNDLTLLHRRGQGIHRLSFQRHHPQAGVDAGTTGRAGLAHRVLIEREGVNLRAAVVVDEQLG